jgi:uridine kinase
VKSSNYNIWFALCYELLITLSEHYKRLKNNYWVKLALRYCHGDWVLWKVENTLKSVDRDIEKIVEEWDKQEPTKHEFIEHDPDGSRAQSLLGGAMEIKSTWRRD